MAIATLDKTDALIRDAVTQQLEWDAEVDARDIAATVHDGVVTLTGYIDSYAGKLAAERAVKRVRGVRVVANDIQVRLRLERPDPDLAADIATMLRLRWAIPQSVQAVVHNGHVTLTGAVPTPLMGAIAANAVRHIVGVKGIANHLTVLPAATTRDLRRRVGQALHRSAEVDARNLTIVIEGSTVTLDGEVDSWAEAEAAEQAVMRAPGVTEVDNRIRVSPHLVPTPPPEPESC
jgi:osmotically-inducible protein OsmY